MTEPFAEPLDSARARMHAQAAESRRRNAAIESIADAVEAATGVASSPDGGITVTAATTGAVITITLRDRALEEGASALSASLVKVVAAAQRAALEKAAQLSADELGAEHPLVADLQASAGRFGHPDTTLGYR